MSRYITFMQQTLQPMKEKMSDTANYIPGPKKNAFKKKIYNIYIYIYKKRKKNLHN